MIIDKIIEDPPKIHHDSEGKLVSYSLDIESLKFINNYLGDNYVTLETGAGISTILFAEKSSQHTCIVPSRKQVENITNYCKQHSIKADRVTFIIDRSEEVLPNIEIEDLDLVLIDGRHAFPSPFIDWYYTSSRIKIGGLLIVDDTQLWTCQVLKNFLLQDPNWAPYKEFPRTIIFKKINEVNHNRSWLFQPFVEQRSSLHPPGWRRRNFYLRIQNGIKLLRDGEFTNFLEKIVSIFSNISNK